jgi:outer membrane protein assembly factor BamD
MKNRRILIIGLTIALAISLGAAALLRADWIYSTATDRWVNREGSDVDTSTADQQGRYNDTQRILEGWLKYYRDRRDCQSAYFLLGETFRAKGDYDKAFTAFEDLLNKYSGTDLFDAALGRETQMAQDYLAGKKHKVMGLFWTEAEDEAATMLEKIFQRDPRGVRGKKALLTLADYHFRTGHFSEAEDEYQRLASHYPKDADIAQYKLLAAQSALARFRSTKNDSRPLSEAEQRFKQFQEDNPNLARKEQVDQVLQGINERKAEKDFQTAEFFKKTHKDKGAVFYYRAIIKDYPQTVWSQRAHERLAAMGVDDKVDAITPPTVIAGLGLPPRPAPAVAANTRAGPNAKNSTLPFNVATQNPAAADDNDPADTKPPVVLWAGPVAVLRDYGSEGVIEVGWPAEDHAQLPDSMFASPALTARQDRTKAPGGQPISAANSVRQLGEVANPIPPAPAASTSQPEGGTSGR